MWTTPVLNCSLLSILLREEHEAAWSLGKAHLLATHSLQLCSPSVYCWDFLVRHCRRTVTKYIHSNRMKVSAKLLGCKKLPISNLIALQWALQINKCKIVYICKPNKILLLIFPHAPLPLHVTIDTTFPYHAKQTNATSTRAPGCEQHHCRTGTLVLFALHVTEGWTVSLLIGLVFLWTK